MKIALVGNPNCGKTTLFNRLTGRRGKVGNMPGVTVEKTEASIRKHAHIQLIDLPGTYSLYAQSEDERVTQAVLFESDIEHRPDAVWLVIDSAHVRSSLFLVLQVMEMQFPVTIIINQTDQTVIDLDVLTRILGVDVIPINAAEDNVSTLGLALLASSAREGLVEEPRLVPAAWESAFQILEGAFQGENRTRLAWFLRLHHIPQWITSRQQAALILAKDEVPESPASLQLEETGWRMERIREWSDSLLPEGTSTEDAWVQASQRTTSLDRVLTHPIWGHVILALIFFGVFQAVYAWSAYPMDVVDQAFSWFHGAAEAHLAESWWRSLLLDGLLSGIAGIVVFVPQIMILFGLTSAMEATGYMARVGFLGDRFLQRIGLNGRSIVPLVGGMACAVPAVMAARSIAGKRERLLTILVTPMMTCSARLPVYAFLIGFLVPDTRVAGGLFNQQGLFLFSLYLISTGAALAMAWALHRGLPPRKEGSFTMEWPAYRLPRVREVVSEMISKGWGFVSSAGQVILVVSVVLWGLGRFGPTQDKETVQTATTGTLNDQKAALLEASWLGHIGDWIEPAVRPLGYDGRMGIAILSSFAAREVFVGTMSTLYPGPVGEEGSIRALQKRLATEIHPTTGQPLLNPASAASLIVFYMFAMQCMSTVVVVRKELNSWAWALGQAFSFTAIAYGLALLVYQLMTL